MKPPVSFDDGDEPKPVEQSLDLVQRPSHYNSHPSGVECFKIVRHMNFCVGGAVKYLWRAGLKGDGVEAELTDLRKAKRLIEEEIDRVEAGQKGRG